MKIWGVAKRYKNTIAKVKIGDQLLFYLVGETVTGKHRDPAISGEAKAASQVLSYQRSREKISRDRSFPLSLVFFHMICTYSKICQVFLSFSQGFCDKSQDCYTCNKSEAITNTFATPLEIKGYIRGKRYLSNFIEKVMK